jgi:hypothetical protein
MAENKLIVNHTACSFFVSRKKSNDDETYTKILDGLTSPDSNGYSHWKTDDNIVSLDMLNYNHISKILNYNQLIFERDVELFVADETNRINKKTTICDVKKSR